MRRRATGCMEASPPAAVMSRPGPSSGPGGAAWGEALKVRGWPLIDASGDLLSRDGYPSLAQHRCCSKPALARTCGIRLHHRDHRGAGTGALQYRRAAVRGSDRRTACRHRHRTPRSGFFTPTRRRGGDPAKPAEGAHDAMWFAARDLVFGAGAGRSRKRRRASRARSRAGRCRSCPKGSSSSSSS